MYNEGDVSTNCGRYTWDDPQGLRKDISDKNKKINHSDFIIVKIS